MPTCKDFTKYIKEQMSAWQIKAFQFLNTFWILSEQRKHHDAPHCAALKLNGLFSYQQIDNKEKLLELF